MPKNNVPQYDYDALFSSICASDDAFPVDFDDAWQWIGYSTKQKALEALERNLDDTDYRFNLSVKSGFGGGSSPNKYTLSIEGFKLFCMAAGTAQGKKVRRHYLQIEKDYLALKAETSQDIDPAMLDARLFQRDTVQPWADGHVEAFAWLLRLLEVQNAPAFVKDTIGSLPEEDPTAEARRLLEAAEAKSALLGSVNQQTQEALQYTSSMTSALNKAGLAYNKLLIENRNLRQALATAPASVSADSSAIQQELAELRGKYASLVELMRQDNSRDPEVIYQNWMYANSLVSVAWEPKIAAALRRKIYKLSENPLSANPPTDQTGLSIWKIEPDA